MEPENHRCVVCFIIGVYASGRRHNPVNRCDRCKQIFDDERFSGVTWLSGAYAECCQRLSYDAVAHNRINVMRFLLSSKELHRQYCLLNFAALTNACESIRFLVNEAKFDIDAHGLVHTEGKRTALETAISAGHIDAVRTLCDEGASTKGVFLKVFEAPLPIVSYIVNNTDTDINKTNMAGMTVVDIAISDWTTVRFHGDIEARMECFIDGGGFATFGFSNAPVYTLARRKSLLKCLSNTSLRQARDVPFEFAFRRHRLFDSNLLDVVLQFV